MQEVGGVFHVLSADLESLSTPEQVAGRASDLVAEIDGLARLYLGSGTAVVWTGTVRDRVTRTPHHFVSPEAALGGGRAFDATIPTSAVSAPPRDELREAAEAAASDALVGEALRYVAQGGWPGLRKAREIVGNDVRGYKEIEGRGWAPVGSMERFRQSANKPEASGDAALHASDATQRLTVPRMNLPEATHLIEGVVRRWLEAKRP